MFTVDKLGRRPLLLGGVSGIVVALLALGGLQYVGADAGPATLLSCAALLLYVGAYQVTRTTVDFTSAPIRCLAPPRPTRPVSSWPRCSSVRRSDPHF